MTKDLYRKQAVEHSTRSLYGEVVLTAPPAIWIMTFILTGLVLIMAGLLIGVTVEDMALWRWLLKRAG